MKFGTKAIHAGIKPDPTTGAVMTPIYQTSTYAQKRPGEHQGYEYARTQNPTREALENNLAALESGTFAACFSSGMSATETVIKTLNPGDEVISMDDIYGGSYRLFETVFSRFGIKFQYLNLSQNIEALEQHITPKTKMLWLETPTNPMLRIVDIQALSEICKKHNIVLVVDNTFASPYLQRPLELGADVVVHSITKFIAGHSDVIMGAVITNDKAIADKISFLQNTSGAVPSPNDCFLTLRGIKTLHLRVQRACENATEIAQFLKGNKRVERVLYPGLSEHVGYETAKKQMSLPGAIVSFLLKGASREETFSLVSRFKVFTLAESLGGVESLAGHPASMTHASIPLEQRQKTGVLDNLVRLSVGIEDVEDLIEDLKAVLA